MARHSRGSLLNPVYGVAARDLQALAQVSHKDAVGYVIGQLDAVEREMALRQRGYRGLIIPDGERISPNGQQFIEVVSSDESVSIERGVDSHQVDLKVAAGEDCCDEKFDSVIAPDGTVSASESGGALNLTSDDMSVAISKTAVDTIDLSVTIPTVPPAFETIAAPDGTVEAALSGNHLELTSSDGSIGISKTGLDEIDFTVIGGSGGCENAFGSVIAGDSSQVDASGCDTLTVGHGNGTKSKIVGGILSRDLRVWAQVEYGGVAGLQQFILIRDSNGLYWRISAQPFTLSSGGIL